MLRSASGGLQRDDGCSSQKTRRGTFTQIHPACATSGIDLAHSRHGSSGFTLATAFAVFLVWPRPPTATAAQRTQIDMGGFRPAVITAKPGELLSLQIINPDSSMHSDGVGWHQFAIPELGVAARLGPRSDRTIEIPAAAPGEYAFYCDVCCGGKENPSMQGVFKVTA
jgi:plastocyanin